jgi:replicative DNA helicase
MNETAAPEPAPRLCRLTDVLGELQADAAAAHEARVTGVARGPVTGMELVDRELSGVLMPGVHIVHGNAGTGKTALCLQIASSCGSPALFVSCEMAPVELMRRLMARITGTYLGRLKSGELPPDAVAALARQTIEAAPGLHLVDATQCPATPQHLADFAQIVRGDAPHLLLIVDSLHSWAEAITGAQGGAATEYESLNLACAELRKLALALRCPLLAVAERNRDSMRSGGLNAGAGTRKIEYGAESVIDLDRKTEDQPDGAGEVPITLKLAKNRHGAAWRPVTLSFNGALQRFRETDTADLAPAGRMNGRGGTRVRTFDPLAE